MSKFLNSFLKIHNIKHNPDKLRRKLNKYSILDFTKSSELIDIGKNYHHCIKINYC